jgi:hypothetical protein
VGALATGTPQPAPIVDAVAERQEKLSALDARIRAAKTAPEAISTELSRLEREARRRLGDFRTALASHPTEARAFLAKVFTGPLIFTPDGNRYRIEGEIPAASVLFAGAPNYASPGGFELPIRGLKKHQSRRLLDRQAPDIPGKARVLLVPPRSGPFRPEPWR